MRRPARPRRPWCGQPMLSEFAEKPKERVHRCRHGNRNSAGDRADREHLGDTVEELTSRADVRARARAKATEMKDGPPRRPRSCASAVWPRAARPAAAVTPSAAGRSRPPPRAPSSSARPSSAGAAARPNRLELPWPGSCPGRGASLPSGPNRPGQGRTAPVTTHPAQMRHSFHRKHLPRAGSQCCDCRPARCHIVPVLCGHLHIVPVRGGTADRWDSGEPLGGWVRQSPDSGYVASQGWTQ